MSAYQDPEGRSATVLERAIVRARDGQLDPRAVLWVLAASQIAFVNSRPPIEGEFPAEPYLVERDGQRFLALYADAGAAASVLTGDRVLIHAPAMEVLRRLPAQYGVVVNPGGAIGFEVPAVGARAFILDVLETATGTG